MSSRTIWIVPILPISMRYSYWWNKLFVEQLKKTLGTVAPDVDVSLIDGHGTKCRTFSSAYSFMNAQLFHDVGQIEEIVKLSQDWIRKDDIILVLDAATSGIIASSFHTYKPCKVVGICHATALNLHDIFESNPFKVDYDLANLRIYDKLFVASNYHRTRLVSAMCDAEFRTAHHDYDRYPSNYENIISLGALPDNPMLDNVVVPIGENLRSRIAIVDRDCTQKRDTETIRFLSEKGFAVDDIFGKHMSYEQFYTTLATYRFLVVTAKEETYGYQVQEAMRLGVTPLCPNALCYPEFVPSEFLYENKEHLVRILTDLYNSPTPIPCPTALNISHKESFWERLLFHILGGIYA